MNILLHSEHYYPTEIATANRMKNFADIFVKLGHRVVVSTPNLGDVGQCDSVEQVICCKTIPIGNKSTLRRMLNNISFAVSSVLAVRKYGKIDVVITTSPPPLISVSGWLIAKLKRAKLVYDIRDLWPDVAIQMGSFSQKSIYSRIFRSITDFMCHHADLISVVTQGKKQTLAKRYPKCVEKLHVVGNGFDEELLSVEDDIDFLEQYRFDSIPTCVYIGNIGHAQGLEKLLKLAGNERFGHIRFLLFGGGIEAEELRRTAEERCLQNVVFGGYISHRQAVTAQRYAMVSFIPLKNSLMLDSVPSKLYEALGLGCPVFLAACGDASEILEESGFGICASPDDDGAIAEAFGNLLTDYDNIYVRKERAMGLISEHHSRQKNAIVLEKTLCDMLGENSMAVKEREKTWST